MKRFVPFLFIVTMLAACTLTHELDVTTAGPIATEPELTATATPMVAPSMEEITSRVSAVAPVTIYSGTGSDCPQSGILEAGANVRLLETREGGWMNIECLEGISGDCWISWDMNAIHSYEGLPITLNIPDPSSLKIESTNRTTYPDGRWEALITQTENVALDGEVAVFFHTELIVTSLEDGTTWKPVSKWHVYGISHEYVPMPFHWSQDGRYLYYSSLFDMHGACVSMNVGETLDRLDLTGGTVTALQLPRAFRLLSISPDEEMIAYLGGQSITNFSGQQVLIVRSPDNRNILVTATTLADEILCKQAGTSTWELNLETGELPLVSNMVFPTATP